MGVPSTRAHGALLLIATVSASPSEIMDHMAGYPVRTKQTWQSPDLVELFYGAIPLAAREAILKYARSKYPEAGWR